MKETTLERVGGGFENRFVSLNKVRRQHSKLIESAKAEGKDLDVVLKEQMVSGDFVSMANVLDRELQAMYKEPTGPKFDLMQLCKKRSTRDFRNVETYTLSEIADLEEVHEKEDYHSEEVDDALLNQYKLKKWGRLFTCSWEAYVNSDLGQIQSIPTKLMRAARRRRNIQISAAYRANAVFYTVAHANLGTGALNEARIETGIRAIMAQTDGNGNPIEIYPKFLVHPVALTHMAQRLTINIAQIVSAITRGAAPLDYSLIPVCDPRLDAVSTTGWYLFCDPADLPALEFLQLTGHENPELFIKDTDARRLSEFGVGGETDPYDGDFYNDDIEFKGRDIHNITTYDYRASYYSTGAVA